MVKASWMAFRDFQATCVARLGFGILNVTGLLSLAFLVLKQSEPLLILKSACWDFFVEVSFFHFLQLKRMMNDSTIISRDLQTMPFDLSSKSDRARKHSIQGRT
ncbi:hypothetical protein KSP39_PZI009473 [Platanthera zijinensis]|uniref:Uncharacterized protein n=1 Tax=Platanthera zijinensis TaxID=2320716 RepID=A0AAP0BKP9_9ASPA